MISRFGPMLLVLGLATPLLADSVELEIGMGASYYSPGLSRILIEDRAFEENLTPLSYSLPGNPETTTNAAFSGFGQLDLYSNDFLLSIFFRGHNPTTKASYQRPTLNSIALGNYDFEISDQIFGVGFNHIFYAMNDRLRIIPSYGFIGYSQNVKMHGKVFSISNSTTPATIGLSQEKAGNARSSASSLFLGLGVEYDWSETIRLKGQIRYMPPSHGSYDITSDFYSLQIAPTGGGTTLTTLGLQFQEGGARHAVLTTDFKVQYSMNDYVQLNMGLSYERIASYYKPKPTIGYYSTYLQDGSGTSRGGFIDNDLEIFSDPAIYRPLGRNMSTLYFSVTFRTGRDNI